MASRLIFFLLVFANLVFFAWAQGNFGGRLLGPDATVPALPAARPADLACRIIGGLSMDSAEALKAAALADGAEAQLIPQVEPAMHFIVISDLPNAAAAEKKAAELKRFGVVEQETVALDGGRQEIILGRLPTEAAAREIPVPRLVAKPPPPAPTPVAPPSAAPAKPPSGVYSDNTSAPAPAARACST